MSVKNLKKSVFIGNGAFYRNVEEMFWSHGWETTNDMFQANFLCLTGGADIHPSLYDESSLSTTHANRNQDEYDLELIGFFDDKPKLGICRGGQLLNVMSGGKMWQHIDNHGGTHLAVDKLTGKEFYLSSIHHQEMIPGDKAEILAVAHRAREKHAYGKLIASPDQKPLGEDIEALWYAETQSLCFQPHPEIGPQACTNYFFDLVDRKYFGILPNVREGGPG